MTTRVMHFFAPITLVALFSLNAQAATFWTGPKVTFSKANFGDWTQAANQDRLTGNVWITRADFEGLFNIAPGKETAYDRTGFSSPTGTEWALGSIADGIQNLTFKTWRNAVIPPESSVGKTYVLHLISDDIYIDVKFLSWQSGRTGFGGGGFSYERSTVASAPPSTVPALPLWAELLLAGGLSVLFARGIRAIPK